MEWSGAVVVLVGGGPSLTPAQVERCRGKARVIAINTAVKLAPWADILYFCDRQWFGWHRETVLNFKGQVVTLGNEDLRKEVRGLVCMRDAGVEGFSEDPAALCNGRNSGYQAIHLAAHLGAKRIVLLGYDMKSAAPAAPGARPRVHWHEEHPVPTHPDTPGGYVPHFKDLLEPLARRGIEVLNATPGSALPYFPMTTLEEALCATA